MSRPVSVVIGCVVVLALLTLPVAANQSHAAEPKATVTGTWHQHACGDCLSNMVVAPDGTVWGATTSGVMHWDPTSGATQHFNEADGLPGLGTVDLTVDSVGHPWVAMRKRYVGYASRPVGLSMYDGSKWTTYDATKGLPSNAISALAADSSGKVWAASDAGLARFDGAGWTVYHTSDGLPSDVVDDVAIGPDGTLWAATDKGLGRYRQGAWTTFTQPGRSALLVADPWGQLWMRWVDTTTLVSGFARFDGRNWTDFDLGEMVLSISTGDGPRLWATVDTSPPTLQSFDGAQWSPLVVPNVDSDVVSINVAADPNGPGIYIGQYLTGGLHWFDGQRWTASRVGNSPDARLTLAVTVDSADHVLAPLFSGGHRYGFADFDSATWQSRWSDVPNATSTVNNTVAKDGGGAVWVSGWRHGVARFAGNRWEVFTSANGLPSDAVWALAPDTVGGMWFGTDNAGAAHFDGRSWHTYNRSNGLAGNSVRSVLVDRTGDVWFGIDGAGVSRYDGRRWLTYTSAHGLGGLDLRDLAEGPDGTVWAAGHGWLARFDGNRWRAVQTPAPSIDPSTFVGLAVAPDGAVWVANETTQYGVARYDGVHWTTFTIDDGLLNNTTFDVAVDSRGTVWVATLDGLSSFTPDAPTIPTPTAPAGPVVCQLARSALPSAVLDDAVANPANYEGWQQPLDPGKPVSPYNPARTCLTLRNPNVAYHPRFNGPVWRVGCP